ncbi:DUF4135 domain-containing protein [Bacillus cereus]|uniref:DUF4135 domain-containing protein n=1 Tax=Bacillus cereus TaxID=1396 RepID=UPI000BFBC4A0|nr:DUF4135 domain-containing protein [Bacillus cereus]PGR56524.1 hypothetical protein COC44_22745 [Bacillus cereus]
MLKYDVEPLRRLLLEKILIHQFSSLKDLLQQNTSPYITTSAQEQIIQQFAIHMDWMVIPTIAKEVNFSRHESNHTTRVLKRDGYQQFISKHPEYIKSLFNDKYNGLFNDLVIRANRIIEHIALCLKRIQNDWRQICRSFFLNKESSISSIDIFAGDPHAGKNTVIIELTDQTAFVYKPVSVVLDNVLQGIIEWTNGSEGPPLKTVNSIVRNGYGYFEFIKNDSKCVSQEEVIRFHQCLGKHLALDCALGTVDGHMENIIAVKDTPYRVDLETGFHTVNAYQKEKFSAIEQTGLLINITKMPSNWPIVSGIQAGTIPRLSFFAPFVINDGTDNMEVQYRRNSRGKVTNRIYFMNSLVHPEDYIDDIIDGFNMMYKWITTNKEELFKLVEERVFKSQAISRHLFRATAFYSLLTRRLFLPEVRQTGNLRDQLQDATNLLENPKSKLEPLKEEFKLHHEFQDILNFDIPYFYRPLETNNLCASDGNTFHNFFDSNILEDLRNRLEIFELSLNDNHKAIIECLSSTKNNKSNSYSSNNAVY